MDKSSELGIVIADEKTHVEPQDYIEKITSEDTIITLRDAAGYALSERKEAAFQIGTEFTGEVGSGSENSSAPIFDEGNGTILFDIHFHPVLDPLPSLDDLRALRGLKMSREEAAKVEQDEDEDPQWHERV